MNLLNNVRIGVDVDEVLCKFIDGFLDANPLSFRNRLMKFDDFIEYDVSKIPGFQLSYDEYIRVVNEYLASEKSIDMEPFDGALEKLKELKQLGAALYVVTSRINLVKDTTIRRLDKHFEGIFDDIYFGDNMTKGEVSKYLDLDYLMEDRYKYGLDVVQESRSKVFLFNKPRNSKYSITNSQIKRVANWAEIDIL